MPVYQLGKEIIFPPVSEAEPDGLLAVGGDLSPERLLTAYSMGIFPWYDERPILWFYTHPRFVLFPEEMHISRSLKRTIQKNIFDIKADTAFHEVISQCANKREGTWINKDMIKAYCRLHELGYAHSFECWHNGSLAGGVYGISLGKIFFAESMFYEIPNASKIALYYLIEYLKKAKFYLIDCQVYTKNIERFGAKMIPADDFNTVLEKALNFPDYVGSWDLTKMSL
ncbi:MAG: leucyl/phenylalanyl-tRNA--protein transferase [Spirochaetia bacterium]|nr:leucyl/phenylalanyl-tRNA--protein transferase [Spirochaetia bacterium]